MSISNRITPQNISKEVRSNQELENDDVNFLDIDKSIPGQNFVCLSFVSPESSIKQRYLWYFKQFLDDLIKPIEKPDNVQELDYKNKLQSILSSKFDYNTISNVWEDFLHLNANDLDRKYNNEVSFQTSMRGLKIRGTYDTYAEAKNRSQQLARLDKNHNVYIGQVGYWLPWDPNPHELPEQEYQNKELNTLMKKYQENLLNKEEFFNARNKEKMDEALRQNKNSKRVDEETEKELDKVRNTVIEKNKILQESLEEKKQETEEKDTSHENSNSNNEDMTASVFNTEDPWLSRKKDSVLNID